VFSKDIASYLKEVKKELLAARERNTNSSWHGKKPLVRVVELQLLHYTINEKNQVIHQDKSRQTPC